MEEQEKWEQSQLTQRKYFGWFGWFGWREVNGDVTTESLLFRRNTCPGPIQDWIGYEA